MVTGSTPSTLPRRRHGRRGRDFQTTSEANNLIGIRNSDGSLIRGTILDAMRPFPQWFNRNITTRYDRSGSSIYHGLGVGFQKRFTRGLNFQGAYTWSKSIDVEASNYQVPFARKKLWGDWNISALFMRSSGYPASAIAGNNGWFASRGGQFGTYADRSFRLSARLYF